MASSGSYDRGDQPRTVLDPDADAYEAAARKQRAYNIRQDAEIERKRAAAVERDKRLGDRLFTVAGSAVSVSPDVGHPGSAEALIPIWGPGREALADLHDKDYLGAAGNAGLAISDIHLGKALGGGLAKGAMKVSGPHAWRTKPWEAAKGARQWLGEKGYLKPGEAGHHWAIPQNGWGKAVPEWLKNQPWNIKGLDPVTHGRVHGRYTVDRVKLPRFGPPERAWHGTPDWLKSLGVSAGGRADRASGRARDEKK